MCSLPLACTLFRAKRCKMLLLLLHVPFLCDAGDPFQQALLRRRPSG